VHQWSADFVVDEALVRRLLVQFPELEVESVRPFAEGWDYAIWLVNEKWAFRFPRREICVPGVEVEIEVLPALAPMLPLPVPAAVFVGRPSDGFPWPFFGAPLLPGRELGDAALDEEARVGVARSLGSFLRRLHDAKVPHALPIDQNRRSDMQVRVPIARDQLRELEEAGLWRSVPAVDEILNEAERLPPSEPTAVVHGDLHFRQLLVDEDAQLSGVIDWVDVGRSDPAIDLSLYWSYFPPAAQKAFVDSYGPLSEEQMLRARVLALWLAAVLARYGHVERNQPVRTEALAGLERAAHP
jgi:aminoglycoside phosphotransferase (APT) family kinase protein